MVELKPIEWALAAAAAIAAIGAGIYAVVVYGQTSTPAPTDHTPPPSACPYTHDQLSQQWLIWYNEWNIEQSQRSQEGLPISGYLSYDQWVAQNYPACVGV